MDTPADHFTEASKMVAIESDATRKVEDTYLSRYACCISPCRPLMDTPADHFVEVSKMVAIESDATRKVEDTYLLHYACCISPRRRADRHTRPAAERIC